MARVIWSPTALREVAEITEYLLMHDGAAARRTSLGLTTLGNSLRDFPQRGRPVGRYRELVTIPPYILRYSVIGDRVIILRVRHAARRPLRG